MVAILLKRKNINHNTTLHVFEDENNKTRQHKQNNPTKKWRTPTPSLKFHFKKKIRISVSIESPQHHTTIHPKRLKKTTRKGKTHDDRRKTEADQEFG